MQLKIEWKSKGQELDKPGLIFGFDSAQELMLARIKVYYPIAKMPIAEMEHNLVITGDFDFEELTQVIDRRLAIQMFTKGKIENGTCRKVYPFFINDPALPFQPGLTVHEARGTWSSLPHAFEREEILSPRPMPFYEKFAYVTDPPGGWGVQVKTGHLFGALDDDSWYSHGDFDWENQVKIIRDRDILDIPLGSHPVSGGPGVRLAYFWVYWGNLENRVKFEGDKAL